MPSSISNSNTRKPSVMYGKIWLGVLLLAGFMLTISELIWQNKGFMPHIVDTKTYWSMHRDRVYTQNGRKKIVIVGTSRAQLGIDPVTLGEHFPNYDIIHLAIDGALPQEVIKDLCNDPRFDGIILADVTIPFLCVTEPNATEKEREYIAYYHNEFQTVSSVEKKLNTHIGALLQSKFVIFSPVLSFRSLLYDRLKPNTLYFHMHSNRFRPAYYYDRMSPSQRETHKQERIARLTQNEIERVELAKYQTITKGELKTLYQTLKNRGGNMVFVRMPTTDEHWLMDERVAPKSDYWDHLESWSGIPCIHFRDYAALASFDCPDTSHLDARDVPDFTRRLALIIRQKINGVSQPEPPI